jgi:two-component system, chemotaxis family, chemotaxis protein CheY
VICSLASQDEPYRLWTSLRAEEHVNPSSDRGLGALADSVRLVVSTYLDDPEATLRALCAERGMDFAKLTSPQLEELMPSISAAISRVAGTDAADVARGDLRLLLDTDRYRKQTVVPSETHLLLVVDDDDDVRSAVAELLAEEGYKVEVAHHGQAAWQRLLSGPKPSAILLDLMMPVMSGWELWDRIQGNKELASTPVIIITATGLGPGSFGKTLVLRKPIGRTALLGAIALSARPPRALSE